jgi:hypothetical protein
MKRVGNRIRIWIGKTFCVSVPRNDWYKRQGNMWRENTAQLMPTETFITLRTIQSCSNRRGDLVRHYPLMLNRALLPDSEVIGLTPGVGQVADRQGLGQGFH